MPWPPSYHPVYHQHVRLADLSLHANPWLQTPPVPHAEGLHTVQWLMSDPKQLSSTVRGDCLRFALQGFDSGKLLPHLPLPPTIGPFLLETLQGSQYRILFHQPNVLLEGKPVGVFQWLIAPPWHCIELRLPLPRFLARAGRASAARAAQQKIGGAFAKAMAAWSNPALPAAARAEQLADALKDESAADAQDQRRSEVLAYQERQDGLREAERHAQEAKRESDRLSRRGSQAAARHDDEAVSASRRARESTGAEREEALAVAREERARAASHRQGARAWEREARAQQEQARERRAQAQAERAAWRRAEEKRAKDRGITKRENPLNQATGESNAQLLAPSLLAHVPFPATVEIRVSWTQIGAVWGAALLGAASSALKYYVGFVFDGVLAPGKGKGAKFLLDVLKSAVTGTLIDGGTQFVTQGTWPLKVSLKYKVAKLSAELQQEPATGAWKWQVKLEADAKGPVLPGSSPKLTIEGHGVAAPEKITGQLTENAPFVLSPPADYAHGIPTVP